MKYTLNGKKVSKKVAYEAIRELIPDGGTQYLDNVITNCKENGIESVTLTVGTKGTLKIEF